MRNRSLALAMLVFAACVDNRVDSTPKRVQVEIVEASMPGSGKVDQNIGIQLRAQATNGCYSDIEIKLTKTGDRNFLLKATALLTPGGACPDVMVYKDTTISFTPTMAGTYSFHANEKPFTVRAFTIEID